MRRQHRVRSYVLGPHSLSRRARRRWQRGQKPKTKSANNVSLHRSLVLYLVHHFSNRFVDLPHFINVGCFTEWERNELFNPSELIAHIFDEWLAAKFRRDIINF